MNLVTKAVQIAEYAHRGQIRKFTVDEPYFVHCAEVSSVVARFNSNPQIIAAAYCHDTLEDTKLTAQQITFGLDDTVRIYVEWLTKEKLDNRAQALEAYRTKLSKAPEAVKLIKLADIYSNLSTVEMRNPKFAHQYFREKADLIPVLECDEPKLYYEVSGIILEYFSRYRGDA